MNSEEYITGDDWLPLRVKKDLSFKRRMDAFLEEIKEFGDKIALLKDQKSPFTNKFHTYNFINHKVYVHDEVDSRFREKLRPYLNGDELTYDNLINICIMVKNAGDGFRDVLTQNLPYMDRYTILDTGSTDNTVQIAKEVLAGKRGEIYEEPFINFRDSRNRLLDLAGTHCFYNVMLDDTYVLQGKIREFLDFVRGDDIVDSYAITIQDIDTMYSSNRIIKSDRNIRYVNLMHEILQKENNMAVNIPLEFGHIVDIVSDYMTERTNERKQYDLKILNEMLKEDPNEPRTYYYMATTYVCLKDWKNALHWFLKRIEFDGYANEKQDALYYIAAIKHLFMEDPWEECLTWLLRCYEFDPKRAESLYIIGDYYAKNGMDSTAMIFLKRAFDIGFPRIDMSVRMNIYNLHIPQRLLEVSFRLGEYKIAHEAAKKIIDTNNDNQITRNFYTLLDIANKTDTTSIPVDIGKLIIFIAPGGWDKWSGETLYKKGLGGSETFIVKYSEYLAKNTQYKVVVFCNCDGQDFNDVTYRPLEEYFSFVGKYKVDYCIVSRYSEYILSSCVRGIKTLFASHDIVRDGEIILRHPNLIKLLCISNWHMNDFNKRTGVEFERLDVISYGIDTDKYTPKDKQKYLFIYPNFPNRGLIHLLDMWPKIIEKYPSAELHTFCDTQNTWCQEFWKDDMNKIDQLFIELKSKGVFNHGWVSRDVLDSYWRKAHVWLYPCTFEETYCLTALEAAASKTLAVTNNLAALGESVGNRGVVVVGDAKNSVWKEKILSKLFDVLDSEQENTYIEKNYQYACSKSFENVVPEFFNKYLNDHNATI